MRSPSPRAGTAEERSLHSCSFQDRSSIDLGSGVKSGVSALSKKLHLETLWPARPCLSGYGNTALYLVLPCCSPPAQPECCCQSLLGQQDQPASGPSGFFYKQIPTLGSLKTNSLGFGEDRIISENRGVLGNPWIPTTRLSIPDLDETEERDTAPAALLSAMSSSWATTHVTALGMCPV